MSKKQLFMIVDIGTGNVRVAITALNGEVLAVERDNVQYEKDLLYPDALNFDPEQLWQQILSLGKKVLSPFSNAEVIAITTSSQREGIVLVDGSGKSLIGLPNHDHRGREFENIIRNHDKIYQLTGRYPGSLFSAMKLVGIQKKRPEIYEKLSAFMSISDWAQYKLTGVVGYEHSQASETQLYDVAQKNWNPELCGLFGIDEKLLPNLHDSGALLGNVLPEVASVLGLSGHVPVFVGGADTQLAMKSTRPGLGDIVVVSGTTTPVTMIVDDYIVDDKQKTWTGRHINNGEFVLEANAGVTGLNLQRLKEIFYPNEGYDILEKEVMEDLELDCMASLGSLIADDEVQLNRGGFVFSTPVSHELKRSSFIKSALIDIACSIKENYDTLNRLVDYKKDYVWACGGGLQSLILSRYVAALLNKKVLLREGYMHASVAGGAVVCAEALGLTSSAETAIIEVLPENQEAAQLAYFKWKALRSDLKEVFTEKNVIC
ncbi:FGGY-family carbohydrate kinase [Pseudopedobacter beijingensis]